MLLSGCITRKPLKTRGAGLTDNVDLQLVEPDENSDAVEKIVHRVKSSVFGLKREEFLSLMIHEYQKLQLLDSEEKWRSPYYAEYKSRLLPDDLHMADVLKFLDRIGDAARKNPYLLKFLNEAGPAELRPLQEYLDREGDQVLPRVVAYALVSETICQIQMEDVDFLQATYDIFRQARKDLDVDFFDMNLFGYAKLTTVESPIEEFIEIRKSGRVEPDYLRKILPINIVEAIYTDKYLGAL